MPALELEDKTEVETEAVGAEGGRVEEKGDNAHAAAKATIGIIYPPPEVRNIVDKTASFVARNGPEFETRIRQNELNNPKFNFLSPADPYNAYYRHKVREFFEGRGQEPSGAPKSGFGFMQQKPAGAADQIAKIVEQVVPKEPPPEFEFIADPPSISASDLDVVKLTAQFTARNGRQFLTNLMTRESRNYQFDFLRPQHSLFGYFTKLVEQYTKILIPPKDLLPKLVNEAQNPKAILEQAKYRVEWARFQDRERKREEDERERERVAYAQIDWHDFVVVETVDYQPGETGNLPPPTTPDEVGARVLAQERFEHAPTTDDDIEAGEPIGADDEEEESSSSEDEPPISDEDEGGEEGEGEKEAPSEPTRVTIKGAPTPGADTNVQDMEEDSDPDEPDEEDLLAASRRADPPSAPPVAPAPPLPPMPTAPKESNQPPPLPPNPEQVIIRRDYNPKAVKAAEPTVPADKFLISPITGEKISADKIQEHMRIGLLDPKWIEQRDRQIAERRDQEEVYAPGSAIGSSLKQLAERRTDIFGSGAEETQIGKKIGEEEKKDKAPKVTWDGHSGSMEKVAQKARENISIEDQIAVIHKVQGLLPDDEKEKIGPAMPKKSLGGIAPLPPVRPPQPPPPVTTAAAPVRPPLPTPAPPPRPPMPVRAMVPGPPRPPPMGGMGIVPPPPGGMMLVQPPPQPMMGVRPPLPPMMAGASLLGGPPPPPMMGAPPPPMGHQPFVPMMQGAPPPPPPMRPPLAPQVRARPQPSGGDEDEPGSKRAKTEDQLIPEQQFLAQHHGPVTFRVQVPVVEKSEWNLGGQTFNVTLSLTDSVSVIKAKVFDVTGMQAGKQKLQLDGMFLKDSNTLAYYNFTPMSIVQLQLKERGGRKK